MCSTGNLLAYDKQILSFNSIVTVHHASNNGLEKITSVFRALLWDGVEKISKVNLLPVPKQPKHVMRVGLDIKKILMIMKHCSLMIKILQKLKLLEKLILLRETKTGHLRIPTNESVRLNRRAL